ncbi:3442_t:CDS:10 [Funneliformis caledonium]|uniref:3442_t:CDS:1 n=1 Tax=Funneliformis caledonium TaxID=1117310 RepID=A0A9N9C571_9GLOM|nr:3442_t:CDS:10 [Funneliformis caledonium]
MKDVCGRVEVYRKLVIASRLQASLFNKAIMRGEKRKSSMKTRQEANINWILNSREPTPIAFFRLTHPTARARALSKDRKCFDLALGRSEGNKLDKLRDVNNDEETLQRDWETWLKKKSSCRANRDTGLRIQQDFTSTMTNIVGIVGTIKSDDNKENDFDIEEHSNRKHQLEEVDGEELNNEIPIASVPLFTKKARSEDSDVDEEHEDIYIRAVHLAHKLEPSEVDKIKTARYKKWESEAKPLINTYHNYLEVESVFDDIYLDDAIEIVAKKPYNGVFIYKKHYELNWVQDIYRRFLMIFMAPINQLLDPEQTEFSYRENFINPIFAKVFDDLMEIIHMRTGEIENMLIKAQRIETRVRTQRLSLGCRQDGVIIVNVNGTSMEVGFMEVVGSAVYDDLTKLSEDLEKVLKCMQISLFYQRQHHLQRGASEKQLQILESYERAATIYTMHCASGLYIVDKMTEFFIPNSKDQLHVLKEEVIEKVYMFKSRVIDYYLKLSKLTPNFTHTYVKVDELPTTASPSRKKKLIGQDI